MACDNNGGGGSKVETPGQDLEVVYTITHSGAGVPLEVDADAVRVEQITDRHNPLILLCSGLACIF
jgi:hypothetical protein